MRTHNSTQVISNRMESTFVRPDSMAAEPRSTYFSSKGLRQDRSFIRRMQVRVTLRDGIAEILTDIDGLPVLLRVLVKDAPAQIQSDFESKDADLQSLLSRTLEKMVDRMRGSSLRSDSPSKRRLSIVELTSDEEPSADLSTAPNEAVLRVGPLQLDLLDRTANRGDRKIDLRPREFQLLKYMMQRSDLLLTRAMLFKEVWHYKFVPETNLVDVHMGRLRRKVDGSNEAPMIRNVRGAGFVLSATPAFQASTTIAAERSSQVAADKYPERLERTLHDNPSHQPQGTRPNGSALRQGAHLDFGGTPRAKPEFNGKVERAFPRLC
jgi:DNA-binding winged helix-turn-helix (wHTH) protein